MPQVLIIDEHGIYRRGLRSLIEARIRRTRVLEASDLATAFPIFECERDIDLVLIDSHSRFYDSCDALKRAYDLPPVTRFAVLSELRTRAEVLNCLAAGFHGFVDKLQSDDDLISAVADLLAGRIHVPSWVADTGASGVEVFTAPGNEPENPPLTSRQREVLALLALGRSNKEIAQELNIAEGTTKIHTAALLRSLGARNRTEAVFKAAALIRRPEPRPVPCENMPVSRPQERGRVVRLPISAAKLPRART